jgi:hypothetical protein
MILYYRNISELLYLEDSILEEFSYINEVLSRSEKMKSYLDYIKALWD